MRARVWKDGCLAFAAVVAVAGLSGCKTLSERYIQLEVWKYERCFGHLPPGFVPPGAAAAPAMRPCGAAAAPCSGPTMAGGDSCDQCQGAVVEGAVPAGSTVVPGLPAGPGGSPGPMPSAGVPTPAGVTASRPVVISDEVVLP
ncbi:MAG: hypothetical protein EBZ59_06115 [Planctomycetia bacterium]|nr:hypothetical protein [Planctomycetia bacterium]